MSILSPASAAAASVRQIVRQQFSQLSQSGLLGYNTIWKNAAATPQAVIAALGTDAVAIFQLANLNLTTLASAAALGGVTVPAIPEVPAGWTLTPNQDGSMTVTPPPATVPTGLTAAFFGANPGPVALNWTAVVGATSYTVQRSVDGGATFQVVATVKNSMWTDPASMGSGTQYQVAVTTPAGTSAFSAAVTL